MRRSWLGYAPIMVAIALAGCGPSSGGTTAGPAPTRPPSSPAAIGSASSSPLVVTPKPGNPTPVATASPANGTILSSDLVAQLAVRCGPDGLEVSSDRVRASRDGVHLLVTGDAGYSVGLEHALGGDGVDVQATPLETAELIPPGTVTVSCAAPSDPEPAATLEVVVDDPDDLYRPYQLGTGVGRCVSGDALYAPGARGATARPVKQARSALRGLRPGDIVERAGYPVEVGRVRVVRDGEVIGSLAYRRDGHGGWLLEGHSLCDGLGTGG